MSHPTARICKGIRIDQAGTLVLFHPCRAQLRQTIIDLKARFLLGSAEDRVGVFLASRELRRDRGSPAAGMTLPREGESLQRNLRVLFKRQRRATRKFDFSRKTSCRRNRPTTRLRPCTRSRTCYHVRLIDRWPYCGALSSTWTNTTGADLSSRVASARPSDAQTA